MSVLKHPSTSKTKQKFLNLLMLSVRGYSAHDYRMANIKSEGFTNVSIPKGKLMKAPPEALNVAIMVR